MGYVVIEKEKAEKEIEAALKLHCRRRARHLCKIFAETFGADPDDKKIMYNEMKVRYGLQDLN